MHLGAVADAKLAGNLGGGVAEDRLGEPESSSELGKAGAVGDEAGIDHPQQREGPVADQVVDLLRWTRQANVNPPGIASVGGEKNEPPEQAEVPDDPGDDDATLAAYAGASCSTWPEIG